MKNLINKFGFNRLVLYGVIVLLVILIILTSYFSYLLSSNFKSLKNETASSTQSLNKRIDDLESVLSTTSDDFAKKLAEQQEQSESFEDTIDDIAGTVGTLEKLSKTDRELLQKYSRVYFLSDNYVPMRLKTINSDFLANPTKDLQFHALALPFLEDMLIEAEDDGINLKVLSAYRSFGTQSLLKANYLMNYGSGSNQFSADQGYSEHQLGTTIDLTTSDLGMSLGVSFENTEAYKWLEENAYKYGFILSYPKGNAYYQYEPWHWRFVGVKLATTIHRSGESFADMDQREIDSYLVKIFD